MLDQNHDRHGKDAVDLAGNSGELAAGVIAATQLYGEEEVGPKQASKVRLLLGFSGCQYRAEERLQVSRPAVAAYLVEQLLQAKIVPDADGEPCWRRCSRNRRMAGVPEVTMNRASRIYCPLTKVLHKVSLSSLFLARAE